MAYRHGDRHQMNLFPQSIEDYVSQDDPVRAYDAFVEALDLNELGIILDEDKIGNSEYYPKSMLKLIVYGCSYGTRSSRKLERATHHNCSFIWLMGGLKPDYKTISNFSKNNRQVLKKVLKQCARLCVKLNLIEGNTLFVDGTKIRGNASIKNTWTKDKCERHLKQIDQRIESILSECDAVDKREEGQSSLVKMEDELKDQKKLKSKVKEIIKELEQGKKKYINSTDSDCTKFKSRQGSHAGFNAQIVVDEKHGLIVNSDVVSEGNDLNQFSEQINQANEILNKKCNVACADAGYANTDDLKKIDDQNIKVIVPSQKQASKKELKPFDKANFIYDAQKDCYICPQGHQLPYSSFCQHKNHKVYQIANKSICRSCICFGTCTKSKQGRRVRRLLHEDVKLKLESQYKQPDSQAIYKLRQQKAELPFGHIKRNLGVNAFLLRGLDGVKAEASILFSCFNISRMITILGVQGLVQQLMN